MESESHRLVHSLTAHLALYHSRIYNQSPKPTPRDSILRWFSSLSSAHRQAALTISDPSFIEIVTQMQFRLCRHGHSQFLLLPDLLSSSHPSLPSLSFRPSRGLLSRSAASNTSAALLSNSILFFPSAPSGASSEEALTVSESLLTEVDRFVNVMDSLSGGRFLCEEIDTLGLTVQWVELPWLKDMGYYSLEAFIANRLEVVLRLAWIGSLGGKKPKEKRAKEMAAEVTGKAANTFWRMKGCLGWWIGLDPGARKTIISYFFGKGSKALSMLERRRFTARNPCTSSNQYEQRRRRSFRSSSSLSESNNCNPDEYPSSSRLEFHDNIQANEIIKDKNTSLMNRFGFLNIGNVKLPHSASSAQKNHEQALFRRDANISLDFLPSKAPNNLVIIWNKLVVVHDISCMLLAWQSSKCAVEELFFGSLGSNLTVTHQITMKLQRLLMVVYTNFINHELMEDTKRHIYPGKKAEEKSNLVCQKVKSKSHSCSKKSNILHKACKESSKNLDDNSGHISSELSRCIVSCAINNVTEVKSLVVHEKLENANVSTSDDYKKNKGKRKNRRKGAKNKSSNSKNIGVTNHEVNKDTFLSISTGRKPDGTCVAPSVCDISQEYMMINVFQSSQDIQNNQSLNLGRVSSTNYEECRHFSGENGSDMGKCVSPNKPLDAQASSTSGTSPSTCDLGSMATDGRQKHLISTVGKGTASKSFISNKCLNTAADEQRFIMHNNGNECYTDGGIDSMGGASYEWPSITPLHFSSINSHIFPATDRLHLDVGGRSPYHSHQSSLSSNAHVRNLFTGSVHGQILPSFTCPMSYDWPPMVKSCSICSQSQNISYESVYNLTMPSLCSRLALWANHGVQVIGDSDARHDGDIIDACDMKSISDLVEDESNWFSEEESEPHARPGRDYNKYFGDGVMYWNPTELVGIGFSRPPSHSSEDSSWAWHEADLNRTIDDMVGCKSGLPAYNTNGKASPPSSYCSPFDNLTSGHQSMGYTVAVNDGSNCAIHSSSISYSTEEKISSGTSKSTACIEGVNGDPSSYPILRPIIIPAMSRKGSRSDLRLGHDNRSSCLPSSRSDNPRIKRPPSPVVLCVPQVSRPPPGIGESRKRGLPTVRSGSSSPRHWGVKSFCHDEGTLADIRHCLDGAEVVWPVWARKGLGVTAVAQSLQGSLLQDHFINISQLAHDQEHPDVTLRLQCPELLNRHSKESLLQCKIFFMQKLTFFASSTATKFLHRAREKLWGPHDHNCETKGVVKDVDFVLVAAKNLVRKPYINWAVKRVTRSLQVLWPRSRTNIFGSNATGLALPTSDVDIVVSLPPVRNLEPIKEAGILEGRNGIKETCLQHATRYLANQEWIRNDSLKTIENTAIPLIMLVAEVPCDVTLSHGTSSQEKSSKICEEHSTLPLLSLPDVENVIPSKTSATTKDNVVDLKSIRLDISFKSTSHTGLQTSELVRELTQQFPATVPLALVLKKFLADRSLDHSYSGGLSSYCLVLLITRFLQHEHHCGHSMKQNLGSLLMDFLYFFGNVFDPRHMRISIQGSGVYMKRERGHSIDPIHIDDPLFPANNVGRNCFRIHQCIKAFADAFTMLENELAVISEKAIPDPAHRPFSLLRKIVPSIDFMD